MLICITTLSARDLVAVDLDVANYYYTSKDDSYNIQDYKAQVTYAEVFKNNYKVVSQVEVLARRNAHLNHETFDGNYIYFKALYLEYLINKNYSFYIGKVPYLYDELDIYNYGGSSSSKTTLGEGLFLISGNIRNTVGISFHKDRAKINFGYIAKLDNFLDGASPYQDFNMQSTFDKADGLTLYIKCNPIEKHIFTYDSYLVKARLSDKNTDILAYNGAIQYLYDDTDYSGYKFINEVAYSYKNSDSDTHTTTNGYAYRTAIMKQIDYLYETVVGFEYIKTSKDFVSIKTSVVNNRNNMVFGGSNYNMFSTFSFSKDISMSFCFSYQRVNYVRPSLEQVVPSNFSIKTIHTSISYHF